MKLVLEQRIAHDGHPLLRWMMNNIFIHTNSMGNIKAYKKKSTEKIDGVIANFMDFDRPIHCVNDTIASNYDSRDLFVYQTVHFLSKIINLCFQ